MCDDAIVERSAGQRLGKRAARPSAGYLEALWKARMSVLASNLAAGETEHEQLASLARHISADYHGRFLIELLQNASDQAEPARHTESTVVIVRCDGLIAVSNQGAPFTSEGISSITALGLSSKDPEHSIGNKGVGFKAVFEITRAPEVYSADESARAFESGSCWFRLDEQPWADGEFFAKLTAIGERLLVEDQGLAQKLEARSSDAGALAFLLSGIRKSAPFRFPVPLTHATLQTRLRSLRLPDEAEHAQTLIVLPIRDDANEVVDTAIDQLVDDGGHTLLFLPHVSTLHVIDRVRDVKHVVVRGGRTKHVKRARGSIAFDVAIEASTTRSGQTTESRKPWRVVERTIGGDPALIDERLAIREAVAKVPGTNWSHVETSTVSVAMSVRPSTETSFDEVVPGRFCIGLPTLQPTGTPVWVDARFHGNIARTKIVAGLDYNTLLFNEAVRLCSELVDDLKESESAHRRRLVAVAVARTEQADSASRDERLLAEAFEHDPGGVARGEVVLSFDGATFLRCEDLAIPAPEEATIFRFIREAVDDIEPYGIVLPDAVLLDEGRAVLDRLPDSRTEHGVPIETYLERPGELDSLIERTATHHRQRNHSFWQPFISWLVKRVRVDMLEDQNILPIASGGLARPVERVFLRPVPRSKTSESTDVESSSEGDDDGALADELQKIPDEVAETLRFLDERAIPARVRGGLTLTDLARQLAPERGGLVKRPRIVDVLNEAVAPALVAATVKPELAKLAVRLLAMAVRWLRQMPHEARGEVRTGALLVPVVGIDGGVAWRPPTEVRFHASWTRGRNADLLDEMFAAGLGHTLLSWNAFAELAGERPSIEEWRQDLEGLGVWPGPRLIVGRRLGRAPFKALHNALHVVGAACPIELAKPFWNDYLASFQGKYVVVASGQPYELEDVTWIEGLEREELRPAIVESVLRNANRYRGRAWTHVRRQDGQSDARPVRSLWADAIRRNDWPALPTERHNPCAPSITFQLEPGQRRVDRFKLLPTVPSDHASHEILGALGITTVNDATPRRVIGALHRLASLLPMPPNQEQSAIALAQDMFDRLRQILEETEELPDISLIASHPIPLLRARSLVAVDMNVASTVYVVDDPLRLRLLARDQPISIPLSSGENNEPLVKALRDQFGEDRLRYTSQAVVQSGFEAASMDEGLLATLVEAFQSRPLEVDLALLIAYVGKEWWGPSDERFVEAWGRLARAKVVRGRFADWFEHRSMVEHDEHGASRLLVSSEMEAIEVLEAAHGVIGASHRDAFAIYARAVVDRNPAAVELFFSERDVGATERDEIIALVGSASSAWIVPLRPIVFALWRKAHETEPVASFEDSWRAALGGTLPIEELLGGAAVVEQLHGATKENMEHRVADLLEARAITAMDLRRAFEEIGQSWHFVSSTRMYEAAAQEIAAILMVTAARSAKADAAAANALVVRFVEDRPADVLAVEPPRKAGILRLALAALKRALEPEDRKSVWHNLLTRMTSVDVISLDPVRESGHARREVDEYRNRSQPVRESTARELLDGLLVVASAWATLKGEPLDLDVVRTDARIVVRQQGFLANRFTLLGYLKEVLDDVAPLTAAALASARAFHEPKTSQELWQAFSTELGPMNPPAPAAPTTVTLVEVSLPEVEVDDELKKGAAGLLGKALAAACTAQLDLAGLRAKGHHPPPTAPRSRPNDRRRTPGRSHRDALSQQRLVGALGEAFVFEQFKIALPGFDQTNWASENRVAYGLPLDNASDSFGADFGYIDVDGLLTGRVDSPQCFIEVKSSTGDADGPFFMTLSEWERALECHRAADSRVYLIVRVAYADSRPAVVDILVDPVSLERSGHVRLIGTEFCVNVGDRRGPGES
jgi:hypothetical protein